MTDYNITWEATGETIHLPDYTVDIAEKIESVMLYADTKARFRDKIKKMYDFLDKLLGKEVVVGQFGKFENCDPNDINLLFLKITDAYNRPVSDYNEDKIVEKLDKTQIDKLSKIVDSADKIKNLDKK